ncbi:MAG: hypothetical protein ACYDA9_04380 [Terriglobia bacterium]
MENYFNYFTEIEECFRRCRGTPTLLSTIDWALIESWKEAGIPLEAILIGIERAFQKFSKHPKRFRKINGLAYCSQAIFEAAEELNTALAESGAQVPGRPLAEAPFAAEETRGYLNRNADALEKASGNCRANGQLVLADDLQECAAAMRAILSQGQWAADLEDLEQQLSALEDKLTAAVTRAAPVEFLAEVRREVERGLVTYRQKMTGPQIESLQRQFIKKRLFEHYSVPRLSLFYLD